LCFFYNGINAAVWPISFNTHGITDGHHLLMEDQLDKQSHFGISSTRVAREQLLVTVEQNVVQIPKKKR